VPPQFTDLVTDESGTLAVAYGMHVVKGHLILKKTTPGPPLAIVVFVALGEGSWDGPDAVYYNGASLSLGTDVHFHPGAQSSGPSDPLQGVDSFHPTGLTYNKTAYIAVNVPSAFVSNFEPEKLVGIYRCLKVPNYDNVGNRIDQGSYSANPARCAAHAIIDRAGFSASRVDWASWVAFRDFCNQTIAWDKNGDGVAETNIPRFECHLAFTADTNLATALNMICGTAGVTWQDDGNRIGFRLPTDQEVVHNFNEANIVADSFTSYARFLRERPNRLQGRFRDVQTQFLSETREEANPREQLQDAVGMIDPGPLQMANMNISQAQRLLERIMRIESDNPVFAELRGMSDSLHALPGDYVTVTHPAAGWNSVRCIVTETTCESAERAVDEVSFFLQRIDGSLYSDNDHRPAQPPVTP
jgi:hypothetical protein